MERRILIIGIMLVVIGLVVLFLVTPLVALGAGNFGEQKISLLPGSSTAVGIVLNSTGLVGIAYATNPQESLNFYLTNYSAYSALKQYLNTSKLKLGASGLYGNGVYEGIVGAASGSFPPIQAANGTYVDGNVSLLEPGTYYAIFQNAGSNSTVVGIFTNRVNEQGARSQAVYVGGVGLASLVLMFAGIAVAIYSFFRKPRQEEPKIDTARIDRLYKGIGDGGRGSSKRSGK